MQADRLQLPRLPRLWRGQQPGCVAEGAGRVGGCVGGGDGGCGWVGWGWVVCMWGGGRRRRQRLRPCREAACHGAPPAVVVTFKNRHAFRHMPCTLRSIDAPSLSSNVPPPCPPFSCRFYRCWQPHISCQGCRNQVRRQRRMHAFAGRPRRGAPRRHLPGCRVPGAGRPGAHCRRSG